VFVAPELQSVVAEVVVVVAVAAVTVVDPGLQAQVLKSRWL
jgi:hypothetical protein